METSFLTLQLGTKMALVNDTKNGELPEFPITGPFGGIQSEVPPESIEKYGFADSLNMIFHHGRVRVRPIFDSSQVARQPMLVRIQDLVGQISDQNWTFEDGPTGVDTEIWEPWAGMYSFFNSLGNRIQVAVTASRVFMYTSGGWTLIPGVVSENLGFPVSFACIGDILCFSGGAAKVKIWDGVSPTFEDASTDAVPAKYLFEFGNHLIAMNTLESGQRAFQRVRWTGAGDPTDWTSFNAGQTDLLNDLGPINGGLKLLQYGYIFQQDGIVQMELTGVGTSPFYFQPVGARSKGLKVPRSLCANGEMQAYYIGSDNVYMFDGSSSHPVGDFPIDARTRIGARSRIFADLALSSPDDVFGFVTTSVNGVPFNAYWVVIPGVTIWVFNIDDSTWTRWTVGNTPCSAASFTQNSQVLIKDLIGTIAQQQWTPATLKNNNPFDSVVLGFSNGYCGVFDFTGWSEMPWMLQTGQMEYGDPRHVHSTKKVMLSYKDNGAAPITLEMENESGDTSVGALTSDESGNQQPIVLPGNNSGKQRKAVVDIDMPGNLLTLKISGDAGVRLELSRISPVFSQGGEVVNAT